MEERSASSGHGVARAGEPSVEAMLAAFDAYADQLTPVLFGHWT
jgi:hypothetical protein